MCYNRILKYCTMPTDMQRVCQVILYRNMHMFIVFSFLLKMQQQASHKQDRQSDYLHKGFVKIKNLAVFLRTEQKTADYITGFVSALDVLQMLW